MTERRGDHGFAVAPRRLGDDPGGRGPRRVRRLGVALVAAAATAIVTIAWLGPRLSGRPNLELSFFATPTPAATPKPTVSLRPTPLTPVRATPLPEITRTDGATAAGHVAIIADGMRVLDLATGLIEKAVDSSYGRDAIVRAAGDAGWTCVCFVDDVVAGKPVRIVRIIGIAPTGLQTDEVDVATLTANFSDEFGLGDPTTDVDIGTDGRRGLLALATRTADTWQFGLAPLDIAGRRAGSIVEIGVATAPPASPSPGPSATAAATPLVQTDVFLSGPHVRIAPDGRVAFVWGIVQRNTQDSVSATSVQAWRVALDERGAIGAAVAIRGLDQLPSFCNAVGFAAADRLAWLCPQFSTEPSTDATRGWVFGAVDLDGRPAGTRQFPTNDQGWFSEPMFDRANGQVYAWDPMELTLLRIDSRTLATDSVTFDPATGAAPGVAPGGGATPPDWRDADSAVQQLGYSQIAGGLDGSRIYLLGFEPFAAPDATAQASRGIFVVDRPTLALVDRWAPAADYLGISMPVDGLVAAVGLPGVDATGRDAPWQGSLTIHDAADGRILVRFGQLGQDSPPLLIDR